MTMNLTTTAQVRADVTRPTPDRVAYLQFRRGLNPIARNGANLFFNPMHLKVGGLPPLVGRVAVRDGAGVLIALHIG
jgi:hypothetical protein